VVADGDGAVLIPAALVDEVVAASLAQEELEAWIMQQVEQGAALPGLYPPNADNKARFEQARARANAAGNQREGPSK
jgi:regulator of RNase E activity RraA